jgi:hypothetical protein
MDQLLVNQQGVDAAYRSPNNVSRLEAAAEGSHPLKRAPSFYLARRPSQARRQLFSGPKLRGKEP